MRETMRGAEDGVTVRDYRAGHEYDLGHSRGSRALAEVFIAEGVAEQVMPPTPETAALTKAPENARRARR